MNNHNFEGQFKGTSKMKSYRESNKISGVNFPCFPFLLRYTIDI